MIHDQAATLARGKKAGEAINTIELAVQELEGLTKELDRAKSKIRAHEGGGYWFSSLSNFFNLLMAFFKGSVGREEQNIKQKLEEKARAFRRELRSLASDADAAVEVLNAFEKEIADSVREYREFKAKIQSASPGRG